MHERAARNKNSGQLELVSPASGQLELATSQGQKEVPERMLMLKTNSSELETYKSEK